jgi:TspO/MBR family
LAQPAVVFCAEFWGGRYRWIFDSAGRLVLCLEATFLETAGCGFRADLVGDIHLGSHLRLSAWLLLPYLIWVTIAGVLNYTTIVLNGPFSS